MRFVAVAFVALVLVGVAAGATRPTLSVDTSAGFVVRGAGFGKLERLKVVVLLPGAPSVRYVTATRLGRFTLRMDIRMAPCTGGHLVHAYGRRSGLVRYRLPGLECPNLDP